jgi:hypothetical protein
MVKARRHLSALEWERRTGVRVRQVVLRAIFQAIAIGLLSAHALAGAPRDIGPRAAPSAAAPPGPYAASWAVIIGINDYRHPRIAKLRYAVNDARAVEQALRAQDFHPARIVTLLDSQATRTAIERVLGDDLRAKLGPQDRLLVFFAGHGKTDRLRSGEEEGYLMPVDADPGRLFSTAISMTALRQISDRVPAKHILYVVDACYSGYALFNRSISEDLYEEMIKKPAIQILTAGRQQDEAHERGGHGVFTEVLVRGLSGDAFSAQKPWLALEELGLWVKQRVFAESNRKQLPQYGNLSGEGQFVFLRPGAPVPSVETSPEPPQGGGPPAAEVVPPPLGMRRDERASVITRLPTPIPGGEFPRIWLEFLGFDADKVGSGYMAAPNGEPDGHFLLVVDTGPDEMRVADLELYTSDHRGNPAFATYPSQRWSTTGAGWFLGVERDGKRLNPSDRTVRDVVRGRAIYDLFADGKTWFAPNQYVTVVVKFADGTTRKRVLHIPTLPTAR